MGLLVWLHVLEDGVNPTSKIKPECSMTRCSNSDYNTKVFSTYVVHHSHKSKRTVCAKETHELPQTHKDTQRHWKQNFQASLAIEEEDSEADRPSGMSRKHRIHSRFYWFTEFCNSQCLSHFAAPFISVQAKTFITEGCKIIDRGRIPQDIQ